MYLNTAKCLIAEIRFQRCREAAIIRSFDPERTGIVLDLDIDAPITTTVYQQGTKDAITNPYVFANPALPEAPFTATFNEVGKALESGSDKFCRERVVRPTSLHPSNVDGKTVLPWNARLRINSA